MRAHFPAIGHERGTRAAAVLSVAAALALTGCAARQPHTMAGRFVKTGKPAIEYPLELVAPGAAKASVEAERARVRELLKRSSPPARTVLSSAEASDSELADALRDLGRGPSVARHVAVAEAYRRLGILDQAFEQYAAARDLERASARAYDGMARIWRDVGRPDLAIGDATRAVYYAPRSPEVINTLGTVLLALGDPAGARRAFDRALAFDPDADYARQNLALAVRRMQRAAEHPAAEELK